MKFAISQIMLGDISFEESIKQLSSKGFKNIGLFLHKMRELPIDEIKRVLKEYEIEPTSIAAAGINATSYTAWAEEVLDTIELAHATNVKDVIAIASPMGCDTVNSTLKQMDIAMNDLLPVLKKYNIRLLFEPLHPIHKDISVLNTLEDTLKFVEKYDPQYVGLVLDYYHLWWDSKLIEQIPESIKYLGAVHISDWGKKGQNKFDRVCFGEGIIPVSKISHALIKAGYKGPFEIEVISEDIQDDATELIDLICKEVDILNEVFV